MVERKETKQVTKKMNIEEQLQELSHQTYPRQVDVVDAVMAQVRQHPYMITKSPSHSATQSPSHRKVVWRRIALTAAAAVAALVVINISLRPSYDEARIGDMLAYVSDYDYYSSVEEMAVNPIEFIYEEEEEGF